MTENTEKITILQLLDHEFDKIIEENKITTLPDNPTLMEYMTEVTTKYKTKMRKYKYDLDSFKANFERILNIRNSIENDIESYQVKVEDLRKIPQPEQRTAPWYAQRNRMITASDWGSALGENHYSATARTDLLAKKCGETDGFRGNAATVWGTKYEPVATMIYEKRCNVQVIEFGLLGHPDISFLGASPDGITKDGIMLEIKCPPSREITGIPPTGYWIQVQGQLEICDLDRCDFLECKFEEYKCKKDYDADKDETMKGIVLEFIDNEENLSYEYSETGIVGHVATEWIENKISDVVKDPSNEAKNVEFNRRYFWKLTKYLVTPIYRNKEWFNAALVKLTKFWDEIQTIRRHDNPSEVLRDIRKKEYYDKSYYTPEEMERIIKEHDVEAMGTRKFQNAFQDGLLCENIAYPFSNDPVIPDPEMIEMEETRKKKNADESQRSFPKRVILSDDFYPF